MQQDTEPFPKSDEESAEDPLPPQKPADAMQALSTLRALIEQRGDCNTFYKVENQVHMLVANNAKEGSIRDFFSSATCTTSPTT